MAHSHIDKVSVLTWWRTPHELELQQTLQQLALQQGLQWIPTDHSPLANQHYAQLVTKALLSSSPPDALLLPGSMVHALAESGQLTYLDAQASAGKWQQLLPRSLQQPIRFNHHWMGVPLAVQTYNLLWVNAGLATQLGIHHPPQRWEDLVHMLERAHQAGMVGIAMSQAPWESVMLFEAVALGLLGYEDFRKGLLQQDGRVLSSERIARILERVQLLLRYAGPPTPRWDVASAQVAQGQALLQLGGTWMEGEMLRHADTPPVLCWSFPGTQGVFSLNGDYLVFPRRPGSPTRAQRQLAQLVMSQHWQQQLMRQEGYLAPRVDVSAPASGCRQKAQRAMLQAATRGQHLTTLLTHTTPLREVLTRTTIAYGQGKLSVEQAARRIHSALDLRHAPRP